MMLSRLSELAAESRRYQSNVSYLQSQATLARTNPGIGHQLHQRTDRLNQASAEAQSEAKLAKETLMDMTTDEDAVVHAPAASDPLLFLKTKLAAYEDEFDRLASIVPFANRTPESVVDASFHAELRTEIEGLAQLIEYTSKEIEQLKQNKMRQTRLNAELETLNRSLKDRLASESAKELKPSTEKTETRASLNEKRVRLMQQLASFLDKYYPAVTEKVRKRRSSARASKKRKFVEEEEERAHEEVLDAEEQADYDIIEYRSLKNLLEELLNKCVSSPEDPYVDLRDRNHHAASVEVLLRANVAELSSSDENLIRLIDFRD
jgi:regulator of replication initiation timing